MEGDAGTRRLNPTGGQERWGHHPPEGQGDDPGINADADETPDESLAVSPEEQTESPDQGDEAAADGRRPPRLGRGWAAGICVVLVLLAAGAAVGGYLALRSHHDSEAVARHEAAAVAAAKDCVAATQAPDTAAMAASQAKIVECGTGAFAAQAALYSGVLVDAYQAANVKVQVSDMRAAVERHNDDGSVDVLVAMRVKVTNSAVADQEQGYRLRVQMVPEDGTYKIARLDQVTS
jgi:Mce-associated membrane protein